MNKIILLGRLTKDPENVGKDSTVARFSLAVDRRFKREGHPDADFFDCVAFKGTGDFVMKYLSKGRAVLVEGSVEKEPFTTKDGRKGTSENVIVSSIDFADSKRKEEADDPMNEHLPFE